MESINPFIKFNDGKCREAMTFYKECFGGELEFMTARDTPMEKDMEPEKIDLVMHSTLKTEAWTLVGSDMMMDKAVIGDNVGIFMNCENEEEIRSLFDKLAEEGEAFMPVEEQFWGSFFGVVTDKYNVEWMLNCPKN